MNDPIDNETWLIETGDIVIQKRAHLGMSGLSPLEALIYCVWVADYGMRNAGDLDAAFDLYSGLHADTTRIACQKSMPATYAAFSLTKDQLEQQYFDRFDEIVDEIREAHRVSVMSEP